MIKHIVMFKLIEYEGEDDKKRKIDRIKEGFGNLKNKVDEIVNYEVGVNINTSEAAYDVVINSEFKTIEDLDRYVHHEEHQKAIKANRAIAKIKAVVDYVI